MPSVETHNITNVSTSANITLTKPSGVAAGQSQVLYVAVVCTVGATWTDPADWDIIASSSQAVLFRRVVDGTEGANFTFTNNQALGNQRGIIFRTDGVDTSNPEDDPKIKTTGATTNPTSDSVTAAQSALLVVGLNLITSTTTITVPGGMTEEINDATGQRKAVASLSVGAGATGAKTWTLGASTASATYALVLNPASQTLTVTGFAPAVAFGTPTLVPDQTVTVSGFAPAVAFGTPALVQEVAPAGFALPVVFGTPALTQTVAVTGFELPVLFGAPSLTAVLSVTGFEIAVVFGTAEPILDNVLQVTGFTPTVVFGDADVERQPFVTATVYDHETGNPVGAGAVVQLFDENGTLLDTTTTDAGGVYMFQLPFGFTDDVFTVVRTTIGLTDYQGVSEICAVST